MKVSCKKLVGRLREAVQIPKRVSLIELMLFLWNIFVGCFIVAIVEVVFNFLYLFIGLELYDWDLFCFIIYGFCKLDTVLLSALGKKEWKSIRFQSSWCLCLNLRLYRLTCEIWRANRTSIECFLNDKLAMDF